MKKVFRLTAGTLAGLVAFSAISCGDTTDKGNDTAEAVTTPEETTEASYAYPDVDYGGYEFHILNLDEFYNCYMRVDVAEQTGETVDDAVYARNRRVEEKLNVKIKEINETFLGWNDRTKVATSLQQSIMADDDQYDCAYVQISGTPAIITDGYLVDLNTISELQLDKEWWDTDLNNALEINGKLFCATSPLQFTSLDLSWTLLFNKTMLSDRKLEMPYDLVREGKWTLDKMNEYVTAIANLNGDDSFTFSEEGKAVYGIAAHDTAPYLLILSSGNTFVTTDKNGNIVFNGANERLYNTIEKIEKLVMVSSGNAIFGSGDLKPGQYYYMFANERAAFITTELKGTTTMRPYDVDFGILPAPKFDAAQEKYYTYASENIGRLCIPKTADNLSRTGTILDALSWESKYNVLPLYYNRTICQKGLRDEDSIEMLEIINNARMTEIGMIFGITSSMITSLRDTIKANGTDAASIIASNEASVKDNITKIVNSMQ